MIPCYGCTAPAFQVLSNILGSSEAHVVLRFIRSEATIAELCEDSPTGWRSCDSWHTKLEPLFAASAMKLSYLFIDPVSQLRQSAEEKIEMEKLFGVAVVGSLDSVFIPGLAKFGAAYNAHYADTGFKILFQIKNSGLIERSSSAVPGTTYDDNLVDTLKWKFPKFILGDLHFRKCAVHQVGKIELVKRICAGDNPQNLLQAQENHGFIRARIEHIFGPSLLGKFRRLTKWTHGMQLLAYAVSIASATLNLELLLKSPLQTFESASRYAKIDAEFVREMLDKTKYCDFTLYKLRDFFEEKPRGKVSSKKKKLHSEVRDVFRGRLRRK